MCICYKFNEPNPKNNVDTWFDIHQYPHTIFFLYEYNQHYDMYVSLQSNTFTPKYQLGPAPSTRSMRNTTVTNFSDSGFFVSEDEFKNVLCRFKKLL